MTLHDLAYFSAGFVAAIGLVALVASFMVVSPEWLWRRCGGTREGPPEGGYTPRTAPKNPAPPRGGTEAAK